MTLITSPDGTPLSPLCFGAMQFGGTADEAASAALFAACLDTGVTFFDTAHAYTGGASEEILGRLAAPHRDRLVIGTKVPSFERGNGRAAIADGFDDSRRRLGMDTVDILYLHRFDPDTPLEETFEALADLVRRGHVRYLGVSNFAAWQVMKAQAVADRLGIRIDILQPMYNLVKRQAEVEILPMCQSEGIAAAPYSPLGGGLLTGKYAAGGTGRLKDVPMYATRYGPDWMHRTAADLAALSAEAGIDPATLAVAWAMRHPGVTAPIISARSVEQLVPSLAAAHIAMTDEIYARISALSPAPPPATDRLEEAT